MARSPSIPGNVVPFRRPFRNPDPEDSGDRAPGNAALLAVAVLIVASGAWLATALTSIPRHIDCNFSKHRPCHNVVQAQ